MRPTRHAVPDGPHGSIGRVSGLLTSSPRPHVDVWGLTLALLALAGLTIWLVASWRRRSAVDLLVASIERWYAAAIAASAWFLGIAAAAHGLGWPVWSVPLLGAIGVAMLGIAGALWLVRFRPVARSIAVRTGEVEPRRRSGQRDAAPVYPWLASVAGGIVLYMAFSEHPWPQHVFHMGMYLLGGLLGFYAGSVTATEASLAVRMWRSMNRQRAIPHRARPKAPLP